MSRSSEPTEKAPRWRTPLLVGVVLVLVVAAGAAVWFFRASEAPIEETRPNVVTAPVERGTLQGVTNVSGALGFGSSTQVTAGETGVLTWIPAPGTLINPGEALYAVDNAPVYLFSGEVPVWRTLTIDGADGPDVAQLETPLQQLGYFDETPDEHFNWTTFCAVTTWQKETGQEQTGEVEAATIRFLPGGVRVDSVQAPLGANVDPGTDVLTVTGLDQQVSVDLSLAEQKLGVVGQPVEIDIPGATSVSGVVTSVGAPAQSEGEGADSAAATVPVTITLDDPDSVGEIQQASVTVRFPSEVPEDVLFVPVAALLALPDGGFGVEIVHSDGATNIVPVETGLFAAGRVEITGEGVNAGDEVAVASV